MKAVILNGGSYDLNVNTRRNTISIADKEGGEKEDKGELLTGFSSDDCRPTEEREEKEDESLIQGREEKEDTAKVTEDEERFLPENLPSSNRRAVELIKLSI